MTKGEGIAALILCAGRSSRIGTPKALLPLGGECVVERIVRLFRSCDVERLLAVTGYDGERIVPVLDACGVPWVRNPDCDRGMFSSIQEGARRLEGPCRAFFLLPVDIPLVRRETLILLIEAQKKGRHLVCRPSYKKRRGHPPLLSRKMIGPVLAFDGAGGLRALLANFAESVVDVDCDDPGILFDIDTPEDYAEALRRVDALRKKDLPPRC